jgi:hypothetical protein
VIDIEMREPTARLTLNAVNTTFASVTVDDSLARRRYARCRGRDGDVHSSSRAAELAAFSPAQATSGGRVMGRAQEVIAISADLKARALPAVEAWIRERK